MKKQRSKLFERWFIHHKFPEHIDASVSMWKKIPLKNFVTFRGGKKWAGDAVDNGLYFFFTCAKETPRINEYFFDQEALILSVAGNNRYIKYFQGKFNAMQHVYVLSLKHKYVYWLFEKINHFLRILDKISRGTTIPSLSIEEFKNFEVILPSDNLLNSFNQFAEPIQNQIDNLSKQIDTFQVIKQELIERIYSQNLEIY